MSLVEQPEEILRLQLYNLDALSLLRACRINTTVAKICRDDYFWLNKFQAEFPTIAPPTDITRTREVYLAATIFNGEVYEEGQLKHSGPILYTDILQWVDTTEDVTIYSIEGWNKDDIDSPFNFIILAVNWIYNPRAVMASRPTQIDIVSKSKVVNHLRFGYYMLWSLNYREVLPTLQQGQYYNFSTVNLNGVTETLPMQPDEVTAEITRVSTAIVRLLTEIHEKSNSPVYQRYVNDMYLMTLANLGSSKISIDTEQVLDMDQRRALLVQQIIDSVEILLRHSGFILTYNDIGYFTYDKFVEAQNIAVNALTDEQLVAVQRTIQILKDNDIRSVNGLGKHTVRGVYFNKYGKLAIHVD